MPCFGAIIVTSAPVSTKPSSFMPSIRIFNFGLCPFIKVYQNNCFMFSPEKSVLFSTAGLASKAIWFQTAGVISFNHFVEGFSQC